MSGINILLVEDDLVVGTLLAEMLSDMGHSVCGVETTEWGAIMAAARCRPDLMIVDIRLRHGNGTSAVDAILRDGSVPHIFMSGDSSEIRILRPYAVVLQKPFRSAELARAIRHALNAAAAGE
jgi:CheY-like chemotaxis protein